MAFKAQSVKISRPSDVVLSWAAADVVFLAPLEASLVVVAFCAPPWAFEVKRKKNRPKNAILRVLYRLMFPTQSVLVPVSSHSTRSFTVTPTKMVRLLASRSHVVCGHVESCTAGDYHAGTNRVARSA